MEFKVLVQRIADLSALVDQSAANHHATIGRLLEAKETLVALENAAAASREEAEKLAAAAYAAKLEAEVKPKAKSKGKAKAEAETVVNTESETTGRVENGNGS